MKSKIIKFLFISIIAFVFVPSLTFAYSNPETFGFEWIGGFSTNPDVLTGEAQLSMSVFMEPGNGDRVTFTFFNIGPDPASICDVYFDDTNPPLIKWDDGVAITSSAGVSFSEGASPGHLPGDFNKDPDFAADSDSPGTSANGVSEDDEYLALQFKLADDTPDSYYALVDALQAGTFNVGLHVQAFGSGGSLSFKTGGFGGGPGPGPQPIPEPATMLLLGTGLVGIAGTARRRKKLQK